MTGQTISHYRILDKLGEGGMGILYKAEDTQLKRPVALKFLSPAALEDGEQKARFLHEARAAAALDHPNICTVYEIGEADGQAFIAMAYVEGRSLQEMIAAGPLKIIEALDIAQQIAEGLRVAHQKGVVHRDVKPANVIVTREGLAKLVDFGIALLGEERRLTRVGATMGTTAYMSPEQATATAVDHRTDIWSLGVMLYEMIAGRRPFRGLYADAIVYAIVHEEPEPLTGLRTGVPAELERIVSKALSKAREERYQHLDDLLADLRALRRRLESGVDTGPSTAGKGKIQPSVAVLPFVNMSRDKENEYFSDGMTEDIISALAQVEGLRVAARNSVFQFKGMTPDLREAGEKLKVGSILTGSVRWAGKRLRVTVTLSNVADGYEMWSQRYDRVLEDVFDIQDEISQAIVGKLKVKLVGEQEPPRVKRSTENLKAYNLHLRGRFYLNQRSSEAVQRSIECFEEAIREDSFYADPHAGLAEAYSLLGTGGYGDSDPDEALAKAKEAASKAIELDDRCAEAHTALAVLYFRAEWDFPRAEQEFRRAIELNDGSATVHHQYALFLALMNRLDEALAEIRRAHDLDPLSPVIGTAVGRILHLARRFDEALDQYRRTIELNPQFAGVYFDQSLTLTLLGRYPEAIASAEKLRALSGDPIRGIQTLGIVYGEMGELDKARQFLEELIEVSKTRYVPPVFFSTVYFAIGDLDRAFDLLEQAYLQKDRHLVFMYTGPNMDRIRNDPRFLQLVQKVGFPGVEGKRT